MKYYTDIYSEVLLANTIDTKGRYVAFEIYCWEVEGEIYASVQKGFMKGGEFAKFGTWQDGKRYRTEELAIKGARAIAKTRITKLQQAA